MTSVAQRETSRHAAQERYTSSYSALLAEVREAGLLNRRRGRYLAMIGAALGAGAALCAAFVLLGNSWYQLLIAGAAAVIVAQAGYLAHDAAHRQIFRTRWANQWAARVLAGGVVGLSYDWWTRKHTRHHQAPNQLDRDPDIGPGLIVFAAPAATSGQTWLRRAFLPRQGWLFVPLLTLEGIHLHVASLRELLVPAAGKGRMSEAALVVARLGGFAAALALVLPAGKALAFAGVYFAALGLCLGGAFAPNHIGMPILARGEKADFLSRQVVSSRNIAGGPLVRFAMGGLDRQIEHHLFPSMARANLRRAAPMVRRFCRAHGVPYTEMTLPRAYAQIIRYLNEVGLRARRATTCPLATSMR